jgi:hypothetical protein
LSAAGNFNIGATTSHLLETRPVISSREMRTLRAWVTQSYAKTAFVAGADGQAFLKNLPHTFANLFNAILNFDLSNVWDNW